MTRIKKTVFQKFIKQVKGWKIYYVYTKERILGISLVLDSRKRRYLPFDNPEEFEQQFESLPKYLRKEVLELM